VARRFLADVDLLAESTQESVAQFMAYVHQSVNQISSVYLANDKRYNYTTPKSFLEQIALYKRLLGIKHKELQEKIVRLENGLVKLNSTSQQVGGICLFRACLTFSSIQYFYIGVEKKVHIIFLIANR
jgi:dynein heavy chain